MYWTCFKVFIKLKEKALRSRQSLAAYIIMAKVINTANKPNTMLDYDSNRTQQNFFE